MIMSIHYDTVVFLDDGDQGREVGFVVRGGDVGVVELEEFPGRVGGCEGRREEVRLDLGVGVAGGRVAVAVDGGGLLVARQVAVGVDDDEGGGPVGAGEVVGVVGESLGAEVPAVVVEGAHLGLEVHAALAFDNVVVSETLVPGGFVEDALAVHVDPGFLEAQDAAGREVDAAVVEVVPDGHEGAAVLERADLADVGGGVQLQGGCVADVLLVAGVAVVGHFIGDLDAGCYELGEHFETEVVG